MNPYSGILELLEQKGIVTKVGNKLSYISPVTGEEIKEFRKQWTEERLQVVMDEWNQIPEQIEEDDISDLVDDETLVDDPTQEGVA